MNMIHPFVRNANFGVWRMPGRGNRSQEPLPPNIRELAREIASTIIGLKLPRPILVGYCFGGLLAYIVCQELERSDFRAGRIVQFLSIDPLRWRLFSAYALSRGGFDRFIRKILQKAEDSGEWPRIPISDPLLLSETRERAIADTCLGLRYVRHSRIATPMTDITASDDQWVKFKNPLRWRRYTTGEFESIVLTGGHFLFESKPEELARILNNVADLAYNSY
jgi:surfactin synthase thioesterase subunit